MVLPPAVLVTNLPLVGAGWRSKEGVHVRWMTCWTGRLHLRLLLRNLQDLTQFFVVRHLLGTNIDQFQQKKQKSKSQKTIFVAIKYKHCKYNTYLFFTDLMVDLIFKSLLHPSKRRVPIIFGNILTEAEGREIEKKKNPTLIHFLTNEGNKSH